ncbi:MAG: hypothetical protein ACJA1Z_000914 [Patiriisocius sp.]
MKLPLETIKGDRQYPMVFKYTLACGEKEQKQERLFSFKEIDEDAGKYVLDENNGVILNTKVINNELQLFI